MEVAAEGARRTPLTAPRGRRGKGNAKVEPKGPAFPCLIRKLSIYLRKQKNKTERWSNCWIWCEKEPSILRDRVTAR
jgi:hypothetical protein